jgi:hypothetical protein
MVATRPSLFLALLIAGLGPAVAAETCYEERPGDNDRY